MRLIKFWLLPIIISLSLFFLLRPTFAQIVEGQSVSFSDYLKSNNLQVGNEEVNGYSQIFYIYQDEKKFITEGPLNSSMPDTDGELLVYRKNLPSGDQIFSYNLLTGQTIQITNSGNNTNPKVNGKNIVWEGQVPSDGSEEVNWQIFFFDGTKVNQLTSADISINPSIEGNYIIYTTKDLTGTWRSVVYSISRKESSEVTIGVSSKHPKIRDGKIFLGMDGEEEFTLTPDDLFLLNLPTISTPSSSVSENQNTILPEIVTTNDILQELGATVSATP